MLLSLPFKLKIFFNLQKKQEVDDTEGKEEELESTKSLRTPEGGVKYMGEGGLGQEWESPSESQEEGNLYR